MTARRAVVRVNGIISKARAIDIATPDDGRQQRPFERPSSLGCGKITGGLCEFYILAPPHASVLILLWPRAFVGRYLAHNDRRHAKWAHSSKTNARYAAVG